MLNLLPPGAGLLYIFYVINLKILLYPAKLCLRGYIGVILRVAGRFVIGQWVCLLKKSCDVNCFHISRAIDLNFGVHVNQ